MAIVETHQISKTYRTGLFRNKNIQALKEVSLSVEAGEIFGLLGPNGAGKTTFVKLMLSIARPSAGEATILGQPVGTTKVRQLCGYLPENHRYPSFLNARDTLLFFGRLHSLPKDSIREKVHALLQLVGLGDWETVKIKKYSKGMLQRLGLAQALLNEPQVLFLDEPTDGVDPIGRKEIRDILVGLKRKGTTVFLNSHLLSEVEAICDRVAVLNKGSVIRIGSVSELTVQKLIYEIQTSAPVPDTVVRSLSPFVESLESRGTLLVAALRDKSDLNKILDSLRTQGVLIESLTQQKSSLEDSFIRLIKMDIP